MTEEKLFYDTNVFLFYTLKKGNPEYRPSKVDGIPCISLEVLQETLHINAYASDKDSRAYSYYDNISSFLEFFEEMRKAKGLFNIISPNPDKVRRYYNLIITDFISHFEDEFEERYGDGLIESMDILLLALAEAGGCGRFVTGDKDFEVFREMPFKTPFIENIDRITLLDMGEECRKIEDVRVRK